VDDRDDNGRRHRSTGRAVADDQADNDEAEDPVEGTASKTSTGLRPLPPVPARFDRSQRGPAQTQDRPASPPRQPGRRPNGAPPPTAGRPGGGTTSPAAPTGSGRHGLAAPEPDQPREASAEEVHDLRVRKIDESLTRMTAAHAGLPKGVGATTAKRDDAEQQPAEDPDEPGTPTKTQRRLIRTGKVVALAAAATLFVVAAAGWGTKLWLDTQIREVAALDLASDAIVNPAAQVGDENFLLVGSDNRPGTQRSDSIMVAHLPADRSRAVVVSFPRSLEVDRPACQRWDAAAATYRDEPIQDEPRSKLSTTYETGGPRCLTKAIQKVTGLPITRFIGMDFTGVKEMVDAANGVEICVEKPVIDGVLGVVVPSAGTSKLNGTRALDFVRARNVRGDPTADDGQIQRQQEFLAALLRAAASNQVALDPTAVRTFVSAFAEHSVADNAGADELILLAQSIQALNPASVLFRTAPTTGEPNDRGNEVLRDADSTVLFTALRDDAKLPDTAAAAGSASSGSAAAEGSNAAVDASDVRVKVLNASERSGLASQVGSSLEKLDFTVVSVGNADTPADRTVIRYSADREAQAKVLAAVVPDAAMQPDESETGTLQLVLGANFDDIVSPLAANDGSSGSSGASTPAPATQTATCR